jgi:hypothetical protein
MVGVIAGLNKDKGPPLGGGPLSHKHALEATQERFVKFLHTLDLVQQIWTFQFRASYLNG